MKIINLVLFTNKRELYTNVELDIKDTDISYYVQFFIID